MKLFKKLETLKVEKPKTAKREAEKLFARAVIQHGSFKQKIKAARESAINAGFDFLLAREGFEHGEWLQQCQVYREEISERSIQQYMKLADLSWRWAIYKHPTVKDIEKIRKLAVELVLVSPKPIVELMRDIGEALAFGGYFPEDYEGKKKQKLLGNAQMEFDYDAALPTFQMLCSPKVTLPDDVEKLEELEGTLKSATIRVSKRLKEIKGTIEA